MLSTTFRRTLMLSTTFRRMATTITGKMNVFQDTDLASSSEKGKSSKFVPQDAKEGDIETLGGRLKMTHKRYDIVEELADKVREPTALELYHGSDLNKEYTRDQTLTATPGMKLVNAAHLMQTGADKPFGLLMVADQGSIVGKLSDRRLTTAVAKLNGNVSGARVDDWMTGANAWVTPKTKLSDVCQIMLERNVRHLPVIGSVDSKGLKAKTVRGANTIGEFESKMAQMGAHSESKLNQLHGVLSIKKVIQSQTGLAYGAKLKEELKISQKEIDESLRASEPTAKDLYFRSYVHQWEVHPPSYWIVETGSSIVDCCKKMQKEDVTLLLVTDGEKIIGKLSERRIASAISKKDGLLMDEKVEDWMTDVAIASPSGMKMFEICKLMGDSNVRNLPVFESSCQSLDYDNLQANEFLGVLTIKKVLGGEQVFNMESKARLKAL